MKDFRINYNHHHDHLGTTRYITNENGEIFHTTDTLAYGEELTAPYENDKDEVLNTITYTGHEKDYETDLTYMLARYYSQGYGRFLSPDPGYDYDQLDPMSWNLYAYVRGNPITHLDPTGKWDEKKRAEVREKLKELKLRDKHYYMQLIHKLKMIANFIDKYGDKNMAMGFVKGLDKTGLIAAFEDENGNINLGSHGKGWESYLYSAGLQYSAAQSMHLHLQTMDKLSNATGKLSLVPIVGPTFGFLSGWFGINGSINSKTNEDPNKGLKTAEYIISMGMCFLPSPGEKAFELSSENVVYASEFDATVNALGKKAAAEKIDSAIFVPIQKAIDAKLKEGNNN